MPGLRAGRVVALLLTLAGLFAMHGLAPVSAEGAHHSPAHAVAAETATDQRQPDIAHTALETTETPVHGASVVWVEDGERDRDGSHGLMAACLVVLGALTGALLALLATARRHRVLPTRTGPTRGSGLVPGPPERPPPRWSTASLCVLRV